MPFAAVAGAALGVGGALIASSNTADATKSAAQTQANASKDATAVEQAQFNKTQANLAPFVGAGTNALTQLQQLPGAPAFAPPTFGAGFQQSPGYNFQMQQGIGAIQNSAAAHGGVVSGNTLKALNQFGQGVANQDYYNYGNTQQANYLNDYAAQAQQQQQRFNNLQTIAGSGQNAAAGLGALGASTASQIGGNIQGAANANSAATVAGAQNSNNLINSLLAQFNGSSVQSAFSSMFGPSTVSADPSMLGNVGSGAINGGNTFNGFSAGPV